MSDVSDDKLREAYRRSLGRNESAPDDDRVAALVLDELDGEEREAIADQIVRSAEGAEAYRDLLALHEEAQRADRARHPWATRGWWLSAVAAAAMIVAVAVLAPWESDAPVEKLRDVGSTAAGAEPQGRLATAPERFGWPEQPLADGYRFELFDRQARSILELRSTSASVVLDEEQRERLQPGSGYYWVVEVEGNVATRKLGPFRFELE